MSSLLRGGSTQNYASKENRGKCGSQDRRSVNSYRDKPAHAWTFVWDMKKSGPMKPGQLIDLLNRGERI
jgi:hypothetical protein